MSKNKSALITGISGMVGSHLTDFLLEKTDWDIAGLLRWRSPLDNLERHLDLANQNDRLKFYYGDLRDSVSIDKIIEITKPDYVFHLAAQSFPQTSFDIPIDTYNVNINGTHTLLNSIKKFSNDSIIHVCSSSEVFGRVSKDKIPIDENCNFHPASPYAISKVGTDLIAKFFFEAYGLKIIITRMFTHTGPRRGDVFAESSFAKQIAMIEAGLIDPVVKVGNLNSLRTIADVRDAVRAYYMLLTKKPIFGEIYNIGGSYTCKVGDILKCLISLSEKKHIISIKEDKSRIRPIDADLQIPNTNKFKNHTGWEPEISFEKTMEDLLNYWRKKVKDGKKFLVR